MQAVSMRRHCTILPPYVLERLKSVENSEVVRAVEHTLAHDLLHRRTRKRLAGVPVATSIARVAVHRTIYTAHGRTSLPGLPVHTEGAGPTGDPAIDEAWAGLGATWTFYERAFRRNSLDDKGLPLIATVHFGQGYDNAFWNGEQMVFGDGDGIYFNRFTIAVDIIGHELTHGFTQFTSRLGFAGQSGALNESVSDCFASMVKQMQLGQQAHNADWLIGEGLFTPAVNGVAVRSMKAPGTAYNDPVLGKDPQPATMDGYLDDAADEGEVHANSGIPNHAFYLAATAIGGPTWQGAGRIWYDVLTGGKLRRTTDFAGFAIATMEAARTRFGPASKQVRAVEHAWRRVKVIQQ
jgi:Zn-dependent metalloprotease